MHLLKTTTETYRYKWVSSEGVGVEPSKDGETTTMSFAFSEQQSFMRVEYNAPSDMHHFILGHDGQKNLITITDEMAHQILTNESTGWGRFIGAVRTSFDTILSKEMKGRDRALELSECAAVLTINAGALSESILKGTNSIENTTKSIQKLNHAVADAKKKLKESGLTVNVVQGGYSMGKTGVASAGTHIGPGVWDDVFKNGDSITFTGQATVVDADYQSPANDPQILANKLPCVHKGVIHPVEKYYSEIWSATKKHDPYKSYEEFRNSPVPLKSVIINLNDHQGWTREQIADWLETLDIDIRFNTESEEENAKQD